MSTPSLPPEAAELSREAGRQLRASLAAAGVDESALRLDRFLELSRPRGALEHYKHVAPELRDLLQSLVSLHGEELRGVLLYAALLRAVIGSLDGPDWLRLPPRVALHQRRQYARILAQAQPTAAWMNLDDDLYQKDLGLATLRLYAAAAQLIDRRCGIPRSILVAGGMGRLPQAMASLWRLGGFAPYFQIHTHTAYLDEFNEAGWNECYRCCADLYALHPEVRGMFGASWFYDPQIETISPRLAYLAQIPLSAGAERLYMAGEGEFVKDALATSPTRRQLHEQGRYAPCSYLLAWGQTAQRRWVQQNPS